MSKVVASRDCSAVAAGSSSSFKSVPAMLGQLMDSIHSYLPAAQPIAEFVGAAGTVCTIAGGAYGVYKFFFPPAEEPMKQQSSPTYSACLNGCNQLILACFKAAGNYYNCVSTKLFCAGRFVY